MIQVKDTIVSELLLEKEFVCNLTACKGACCIEGDAGAPLEEEELLELEKAFPVVKKYLPEKAVAALEEDLYTVDHDGEYVTQLVEGKECAFVMFDEKGIAKCAIEHAYNNGELTFKKPISCHLFPVRLSKNNGYTAVNYAHWDLCNSACSLGQELKVKTYSFLKEPLIRKFGEDWFNELELIDSQLNATNGK